MKNWKSILITVFSFFAICGTVLFNSCVKDPCTDLRCQNKGTCSDGFCQCPTGFEGTECEITAASRFTGVWVGNYRCENYPITPDTIRITLQEAPNTIRVQSGEGGTAILSFTATAETPQTKFVDIPQNILGPGAGSLTHGYMYVDGGLLQFYTSTVPYMDGVPNEDPDKVQNCHFSGTRISN